MHQVQVNRGEAGYAMAALLVAMALMAVMMSVAMPVWRQASQREKEAELIWRGQQYDRAFQLFRRKTSAPGPPNLDVLIQQKFLRKKYKDPITGGDFELRPVGAMGPGSPMPGMPGGGSMRPGTSTRGPAVGNQTSRFGSQPGAGRPTGNPEALEGEGAGTPGSGSLAGARRQGEREPGMAAQRGPGQLIGAVRSKSKARSIRELNGRTRYDQWEFVYIPYNPNPQLPAPGNTGPGRRPAGQRPGSAFPGSTSPGPQRPGTSGGSSR